MKIEEVDKALGVINDVYIKFPKEHKEYKKQLEQVEGKRQDLLHIIEFGDLSEEDIFKIYGKLREVQKERRKIKNRLELYREVHDFVEGNKSPSKERIEYFLDRVKRVKNKQKNRKYRMKFYRYRREYSHFNEAKRSKWEMNRLRTRNGYLPSRLSDCSRETCNK